jgi:hypothetical protein
MEFQWNNAFQKALENILSIAFNKYSPNILVEYSINDLGLLDELMKFSDLKSFVFKYSNDPAQEERSIVETLLRFAKLLLSFLLLIMRI